MMKRLSCPCPLKDCNITIGLEKISQFANEKIAMTDLPIEGVKVLRGQYDF